MLSEEDMLSWQGRFKQGSPFRKLRTLFASLRLNLWWSQMHANGYLPQNCKRVRDLVLYDVDELCELIYSDCSFRTRRQGFISHIYANMVPTTLMFKQQAEALIGNLGVSDKLQDIWHRYGSVLDQGFGMRTPGMCISCSILKANTARCWQWCTQH